MNDLNKTIADLLKNYTLDDINKVAANEFERQQKEKYTREQKEKENARKSKLIETLNQLHAYNKSFCEGYMNGCDPDFIDCARMLAETIINQDDKLFPIEDVNDYILELTDMLYLISYVPPEILRILLNSID